MGDLVDVPFDALVISLQLAVGLRVKRRGQYVTDTHQMQIVSEGTGDVAWPSHPARL